MCGFEFARGKYVITLDDDLQNPPEEIPRLISKIKEGHDVVYGEYEQKKHSIFRNAGSGVVRLIYNRIFKTRVKITAFRIIRREIIEAVQEYNMNYTFLDGLIAWNTNKITGVKVSHKERKKGRSGYTLGKLIALSLSMLTNFSIFPLQVASFLGLLFSVVGFSMGIFFIVRRLVVNVPVTGFTATIVTLTFFAGVQLLSLGMVGEYIGRVHLNINRRPQYRIRERIF